MLEMLFVWPESFRHGIGTLLIRHAVRRLGVRQVDCNEQNRGAFAFYEGLGFAVNTVKVDEMAVRSYESISDYIRSRVPGVEINPNGTLRIRGTQAVMGYSEALIVVDGVITDDINSVNASRIKIAALTYKCFFIL